MERLPAIGMATYPIWKCKLFPLEIIAIDKPHFSADCANLNKKISLSKLLNAIASKLISFFKLTETCHHFGGKNRKVIANFFFLTISSFYLNFN